MFLKQVCQTSIWNLEYETKKIHEEYLIIRYTVLNIRKKQDSLLRFKKYCFIKKVKEEEDGRRRGERPNISPHGCTVLYMFDVRAGPFLTICLRHPFPLI